MDFLNEIKNISDNNLESLVKEKIDYISTESDNYNNNTNVIGFKLDENPKFDIKNHSKGDFFSLDLICGYEGYIKKNMKIVYGLSYNYTKLVSNNGSYYYLDTDDYILDFCKYIKDKEVLNDYIFFDYVLKFIRNYFKVISTQDREEMLSMIYKNDYNVYDKTFENRFSLFKNKGNARCSEYAVLAQNILSFFDYDIIYVIGKEKDNDIETNHAFNIISFFDKEDNKDVTYLIDFSLNIDEIDLVSNKKEPSVFLGEIDRESANELLTKNIHLVFDDYDYIKVGNTLVCLGNSYEREYYITSDNTLERTKRLTINK